jgi:DNA helicase-2/ATP-dependent DNA helicase PcrA
MVKEWLANGATLEDIAYMSFSTRAAREPVSRMVSNTTGLTWFRTIHAAAFAMQGLSKSAICSDKAIRAYAEDNGLDYRGNRTIGDAGIDFEPSSALDIALSVHNLARNNLCPTEEVLNDYGLDFAISDVLSLIGGYEKWKSDNGWIDFTDVLMQVVQGDVVPVKHVIIDEAQDLTKLQWRCVDIFFDGADDIVVAGDDDQALYSWAGADVDTFIGLQDTHEVVVLPTSYRVPVTVHELGQAIIKQCSNRVPKEYAPRKDAGAVVVSDIDNIDMSKGTWLLLARSRYQLQQYTEAVEQAGYAYVIGDNVAKVSRQVVSAVYTWERLRKGTAVSVRDMVGVYDMMLAGVGYTRGGRASLVEDDGTVTMQDMVEKHGLLVDSEWYTVLRKIPTEAVAYIRSVLRNKDDLRNPRITISTIHGAKGAEADNVVLLTDISRKIDEAIGDDEHRVWYVAVTRTRQTLYVAPPSTVTYYQPLVDAVC